MISNLTADYWAKHRGNISWDEYIRNIIIQCVQDREARAARELDKKATGLGSAKASQTDGNEDDACGLLSIDPYPEEEDEWRELNQLEGHDPFGFSVWHWVTDMMNDALTDTGPLEELFQSCHCGTVEDVQNRLSQIFGERAQDIIELLAVLALQERRPEMLEFCLARAHLHYGRAFIKESNKVDKDEDPRTFAVLENSEFRRIHPKPAETRKRPFEP